MDQYPTFRIGISAFVDFGPHVTTSVLLLLIRPNVVSGPRVTVCTSRDQIEA